MRGSKLLLGAFAFSAATAASAQLLPAIPRIGDVLGTMRPIAGHSRPLPTVITRLAQQRLERLALLAKNHPREIEIDSTGDPVRAGELLVGDPDEPLLARAAGRGFRLIEREELLGVGYAWFAVPAGLSLARAVRELRRLGAADVSADPLYQPSGHSAVTEQPVTSTGVSVGIIDGGVADPAIVQRGFAQGAPRPSDHTTAVASLITGAPGLRGAAPGARLYVADVYGTDPAGGGADAIARAVGWLVSERVPVITISLVGPPNTLLARVIAAAQARGTFIVAPVGNDGAAAPPAYPASYSGVIAVTGVDAKGRILIEAGHATHLDYAAPAANLLASKLRGHPSPVRGTSFAAPLVAGFIALRYPQPDPDPGARTRVLAAVDAHARRAGPRYGRGILCENCVTPP